MSEAKPVLPIAQGDWVAENRDGLGQLRVGRVKYAWFDKGEILMNVVLFSMDGDKVGRDSPAMGGPRTFEPCVPFDERWTRIEPPDFPLIAEPVQRPVPDKPGTVVLDYSYRGASGWKPKPARTRAVKQSGDRARTPRRYTIVEVEKPSNGLDLEIAGLRRSAQEMRDLARTVAPDARAAMIERADALDKEAATLSAS
ncbi:hypothetical protein BAJUN_00880 [Bajunvirus bajun]|uniref:Uncharacterized protein n=1 Tax=Brevundimonas phage vB_BgoS-Bajun TaxID=2948594 RepID=A0A9E7SRK2_9CAUD|nr:hypothetical protein BAJUN_00880 [Brevundimonas phage vB_BgoS-Bajun]